MTDQPATGSIIPLDDLEPSEHSHEFVGRFNTEWLEGPDAVWTSTPGG